MGEHIAGLSHSNLDCSYSFVKTVLVLLVMNVSMIQFIEI